MVCNPKDYEAILRFVHGEHTPRLPRIKQTFTYRVAHLVLGFGDIVQAWL